MISILILILILIALVGLLIGIFLYLKPTVAIQIQRIFYEKINWRIEPISMQKEIRNTRIMGCILILASLFTIIYAVFR